jgi:hypothetical protein
MRRGGMVTKLSRMVWTTGRLMRDEMISTASLLQARTDGLDLVATHPNHFLAYHHLKNKPFSPGLDHMGWIPASHFFLDRKPMRVGALIMEEITRGFSYTGILSGGMNWREKKMNEMAMQHLLLIQIQTHLCHSTINLSLQLKTQVLLVPQT